LQTLTITEKGDSKHCSTTEINLGIKTNHAFSNVNLSHLAFHTCTPIWQSTTTVKQIPYRTKAAFLPSLKLITPT